MVFAGDAFTVSPLTHDVDTIQALLSPLEPALMPSQGSRVDLGLEQAANLMRQAGIQQGNILLITDGLPTQGRNKPGSTTVSAGQRLKHFEAAVRTLPAGIPVNTILLPMEGDAYAAAAFWKLAIDTRGSFLTPARDWP